MEEWIQNNRHYSIRQQLSKAREWRAELSYDQVLGNSRGYDLVNRVGVCFMRKQPQSHWDKLPVEIKNMIFSYLEVVYPPTNKTLFDLSHSNTLMTEQIFFIKAHRGDLNLDVLNAMRVNTKWYFGITNKHRVKDQVNFEGEWAIYKALENLMAQPRRTGSRRSETNAMRLETDDGTLEDGIERPCP